MIKDYNNSKKKAYFYVKSRKIGTSVNKPPVLREVLVAIRA